jgi:hypothetical protein
MPTFQNLRFQKADKFSNPVFIASNKRSDELDNYNSLVEYAQKLEDKQYDTHLPIYKSVEFNFASLRIKKTDKCPKLIPRATYDLTFKLKTTTKDKKIYVNCYIEKIKMNTQAPDIEEGDDLILD